LDAKRFLKASAVGGEDIAFAVVVFAAVTVLVAMLLPSLTISSKCIADLIRQKIFDAYFSSRKVRKQKIYYEKFHQRNCENEKHLITKLS